MAGEFSGYRPLSYDDKDVFDKAMNFIDGVGYTPLVVASQVVQGIQYKFICETTLVAPGFKRSLKVVYVVRNERHEIEQPTIKNLIEE